MNNQYFMESKAVFFSRGSDGSGKNTHDIDEDPYWTIKQPV